MNPFTKIIASVVTAVVIGVPIGVWQSGVVGGGGGGGGGASWFISPSGSDSNPGTAGSPFQTMNKCYTAATFGDTCFMQNGTYGGQTISSSPKAAGHFCRWGGPFLESTVAAGPTVETRNLTGCVEFVPQAGASVTILNLTIDVPYVYVENITMSGPRPPITQEGNGSGELTIQSSNDCSDVANFHDIIIRDSSLFNWDIKEVSHFYMINTVVDTQFTAKNQITDCSASGTPHDNDHLMFDGDTTENVYWTLSGQHLEAYQVYNGNHVTIQNSQFLNDAQADVNIQLGTGGTPNAIDWLVQNNIFDASCSHQQFGSGGGCNSDGNGNPTNGSNVFGYGANGAGQTFTHFLFRFNSLPESTAALNTYPSNYGGTTAGTFSDIYVIGNVMGTVGFNCSSQTTDIGAVWDHNVENTSSGPACGTNTISTTADQYTNYHTYTYTPVNCSAVLANAVPSSVVGGLPPTDINGASRPLGANADAGAYESCS